MGMVLQCFGGGKRCNTLLCRELFEALTIGEKVFLDTKEKHITE